MKVRISLVVDNCSESDSIALWTCWYLTPGWETGDPFQLSLSFTDDTDLELRLERFEELMNRRPLLLNSVLLRQNPHNVHEWLKRVQLYEGKPKEVKCVVFKQGGSRVSWHSKKNRTIIRLHRGELFGWVFNSNKQPASLKTSCRRSLI